MENRPAQATVHRKDIQEILKFSTVNQLHEAAAFFHANFKSDEIALQGMAKAMDNLEYPYRSVWTYEDHGASNSFMIDARKNDDGSYFLSIRKGNNHKTEVELAKKLDLQIGYRQCEIERTWPSQGETFAIPLRDIEVIYKALGQVFEPAEFLARLTTVSGHSQRYSNYTVNYTPSFTVMQKKNISARIDFDLFQSIQSDAGGKNLSVCEYSIKDGYFIGPAKMNQGRRDTTSMVLTIQPNERRTFDSLLANRIRKLGDKVEAAMRKTLPKPAAVPATPQP